MSQVEIIYLKPQDPEITYLSPEEPVVFEVLDQTTQKNINLEPQVKVHNETKKQDKTEENKKTHPKKPYFKKPHLNNKNIKRIFAFFIVMTLFGVFAFNLGYMPIKALLTVPEPIGCAGEIDADNYMAEYSTLKGIPKLDKIKYKIFVSDASLETVANHYKHDLEEKGYSSDYEGVITKKGITFHYYGFVKGITAIGIILTDDVNDLFGHETAVLSTIGNIYDYKEVISWYKTSTN